MDIKEQLRTKSRLKKEALDIISGLFVRELTGTEFEKVLGMIDENNDSNNSNVWIAYCICDCDGNRLFNDSDVDSIGEHFSISEIKNIVQKAIEINGASIKEDPEKN